VYGAIPPTTEIVIEPLLLEHVEPSEPIVTEAIPFGVNKVAVAVKVQNAASVT